MVDAVDSKSTGGNLVGVRVSLPAPELKSAKALFPFKKNRMDLRYFQGVRGAAKIAPFSCLCRPAHRTKAKRRPVRAASPGRNDPDREMSESFTFKGPRERFPTCGEIGFYALSAAPAGCGYEVGSTHTITRLILDKAVSACGFFGNCGEPVPGDAESNEKFVPVAGMSWRMTGP